MDFWDFWIICMALTLYLEAQKIIRDTIPICQISQSKKSFQMRMNKQLNIHTVNIMWKFKNISATQILREINF